jgi:hypothetical protein
VAIARAHIDSAYNLAVKFAMNDQKKQEIITLIDVHVP